MRKKKFLKSIFLSLLISAGLLYAAHKLREFRAQAKEKECLTYLNSSYVATKAYEIAGHLEPRSDREDIEFSSENCLLFESKEKIPKHLIDIIPEEFTPLKTQTTFRILSVTLHQDLNYYTLSTVDQNKVLRIKKVNSRKP